MWSNNVNIIIIFQERASDSIEFAACVESGIEATMTIVGKITGFKYYLHYSKAVLIFRNPRNVLLREDPPPGTESRCETAC